MTDQNIYFEMFGACVDFGWNALKNLPEHIARFGTKRALIVTDGCPENNNLNAGYFNIYHQRFRCKIR